MKKLNFLLLLPFLLQNAAAEEATDGWQFQLTPYLWLPTISGQLNYDLSPSNGGGDGGGAPQFDVGPTDWLDLLNGVAHLAQRGAYFAFG